MSGSSTSPTGQKKTRAQHLWDVLQQYKRRYKPIYVSLMVKAEFLDVISLTSENSVVQRELAEGTSNTNFSEEEWYRFKARLTDCYNKMDFKDLIKQYFPAEIPFEFEVECSDTVVELNWWLKEGVLGDKFFENPGAILIRDIKDFWIVLLFSYDSLGRRKFDSEIYALTNLFEKIG